MATLCRTRGKSPVINSNFAMVQLDTNAAATTTVFIACPF
jgi:hypothetical protein